MKKSFSNKIWIIIWKIARSGLSKCLKRNRVVLDKCNNDHIQNDRKILVDAGNVLKVIFNKI